MRSLFLKEFRQGRPLLIFSLVMAVLVPLAYVAADRAFVRDQYLHADLPVTFAVVLLIFALAIPVFAGAGLLAGEADHGTVPVLLALPLSRRRIWLAKILAGLALALVGLVILLGLDRLLMPGVWRSLPVSAYLPDLCLSGVFVFASAAFVSAISPYVTAAFAGTLVVAGLLALGLGLMWFYLGALLLGYNPILEVALWCFLAAPALLAGSALAVTRGELLQSRRKVAFAVPALIIGLLLTVVLVSAIGRLATRYSRSHVTSVLPLTGAAGASAMPILTEGNPVPFERPMADLRGWRRRALDWELGQTGDLERGPLYRSSYGVVLDLHSGRELLTVRQPLSLEGLSHGQTGPLLAVSGDGRFAAAVVAPAGLTWGARSWPRAEPQLRVYDLGKGECIYAGVPAPVRERRYVAINDLKWSPRGDYLAFTTSGTESARWPLSLQVMTPDGSSLRELAIRPDSTRWAWSPTEDVIYALGPYQLDRLPADGRVPQPIWSREISPEESRRAVNYYVSDPAISPDGRWIAFSESYEVGEEPGPWAVTHHNAATVVRQDGRESAVVWTAQGQRPMSMTWSSDSRALYLMIGPLGRDQKSRVFRWRPGEKGLSPIGPYLPHPFGTITARPHSQELLVWPYPGWRQKVTVGPGLMDGSGHLRPFPDAASTVQFANENQFVGFDDSGRLITLFGPPRWGVVHAVDLDTGQVTRIYP
jgi:ABC-type transport system involved in multi-copper enzyme maturation permease subunit